MTAAPQQIDLDAEREVDLRSAWGRVTGRWWLPVAGLVAGAALGLVLAVGGGDTFEAKALLYLGQPFTPSGGGQIQNLGTNPKTVSEVIRSQAALEQAAAASGLTVGQLRGNVTSTPIVQAGQLAPSRNFTPLIELEVQAPAATRAERAAASLSATVIDAISPYVEVKLDLFKRQIEEDEQQLQGIDERISTAQRQQRLAFADDSLSLAEKLLVSTNSNATIANAEARRGAVSNSIGNAMQLLSLAQQVERSRIVLPAKAVKASAGGTRNSAAVGAFLGLVLGAIAAVVVDPYLRRRAGRDR
ncbi:MAG: hypothetical protein ACR2HI_03035 [Gaiella sp.]